MDNGFDDAIVEYLNQINSPIEALTTTADSIQADIAKMIQLQIQKFEIKDGRFVASQDFQRRFLEIDRRFENMLSGKTYTNAVKDYLSSYSSIEQVTANIHRDYNDLKVDLSKISPARKVAYEQAKAALYDSGIRTAYKQPVNHMLMVQVTTGGSISDMEKLLTRWVDGDLSKGSMSPTGQPIPNLQQYAGQLASDASYGYAGTIQNIIQDEYGLDGITYVGDIIRDSRPLCVHLVQMKRVVSLSELEVLLGRPDLKPGRIPNTTVKNFCTYRGGYRCRHMAFPVRVSNDEAHKNKAMSTFTPAKDIAGANAFASGTLADLANFGKLPLEVANLINKTLSEQIEKYPELRSSLKFIGSIQERNSLLKKELRREYIENNADLHRRLGYTKLQIDQKAVEYANSIVPPIRKGTMAESLHYELEIANGISFNAKELSSLAVYNTIAEDMANRKWWSKGAGSLSHTIVHELGHEMDKLVDFVNDKDFTELYKKHYSKGRQYIKENLSEYAWAGKNPKKEMIAEAWAEFNIADEPREIAKELGELLIKKYNEKFKLWPQ